jgi:ankyrin repeat protein
LLLDSGANANIASFNYTPLDAAVLNDRADIAKLLRDHNADVNGRTEDRGPTPLDYAMMRGDLPVAKSAN